MLERLDGTFPLVAFPEKLQEYIRAARDTLNFPEPYTASVMLLAVAVAIGNTRVLKMKEGWLVKPILFLALVGEAGANKSHPISFVFKPLDRINNEHIGAYNKAPGFKPKTGPAPCTRGSRSGFLTFRETRPSGRMLWWTWSSFFPAPMTPSRR